MAKKASVYHDDCMTFLFFCITVINLLICFTTLYLFWVFRILEDDHFDVIVSITIIFIPQNVGFFSFSSSLNILTVLFV